MKYENEKKFCIESIMEMLNESSDMELIRIIYLMLLKSL